MKRSTLGSRAPHVRLVTDRPEIVRVEEVLEAKHGELPPVVTVNAHDKVRHIGDAARHPPRPVGGPARPRTRTGAQPEHAARPDAEPLPHVGRARC